MLYMCTPYEHQAGKYLTLISPNSGPRFRGPIHYQVLQMARWHAGLQPAPRAGGVAESDC